MDAWSDLNHLAHISKNLHQMDDMTDHLDVLMLCAPAIIKNGQHPLLSSTTRWRQAAIKKSKIIDVFALLIPFIHHEVVKVIVIMIYLFI